MGQAFLIVDGHSVIFAWDDLRALHARNREAARDALVRRLLPLHDTERRTAVVFDGTGARTTEQDHPSGIKIFYSGGGQSADHVVERLVARIGSKHDVVVVTDDRMEQQTITTFGASWISTAELLGRITDAERTISGEVRRRNRE